jgi:hypothetical protein
LNQKTGAYESHREEELNDIIFLKERSAGTAFPDPGNSFVLLRNDLKEENFLKQKL